MFKTKTLQQANLGAQLREIRERRGLSVRDVAEQTRIQPRYVEALEQGQYANMPVGFVERYLRRIVRVLAVNEQKALAWYRVESLAIDGRPLPSTLANPVATKPPVVLPFLLKKIGLFLLLGMFLTYLGTEIYGVMAPPQLSVQSPTEEWITREPRVTVAGKTAPESLVFMNGQAVSIDEHGQFNQEIALSEGVNVIRIEARKDQGRSSVVVRKVLVQPL